MPKRRIDTLLAERGLAGSRTSAAESVRAGRVRIGRDGPIATKPSQLVAEDAELLLVEQPRFVSRGGIKLENALDALGDRRRRARLPRRRRLDRRLHRLPAPARRGAGDRARRRPRPARLGAAQRRAGRRDRAPQRARRSTRPSCRSCPRWRRSTSRSSRWPRCCRRSPACLAADGELLAMVKPQFELGRGRVGKGGVVRDPRGAGARRCAPPRGAASDGRARRARLRLVRVCRGRRATARPSSTPRRGGEAHRRRRGGDRGRWSREHRASVLTHTQPEQTAAALARRWSQRPSEPGWSLVRRPTDELAKHGDVGAGARAARRLERRSRPLPRARRRRHDPQGAARVRGHRRCPCSAINFGTVGFLAAAERGRRSNRACDARLRRRLRGDRDARARGRRSDATRRWRSTTSR